MRTRIRSVTDVAELPPVGTRVSLRYRRPAGSVPPLTDVIGHLLEAGPTRASADENRCGGGDRARRRRRGAGTDGGTGAYVADPRDRVCRRAGVAGHRAAVDGRLAAARRGRSHTSGEFGCAAWRRGGRGRGACDRRLVRHNAARPRGWRWPTGCCHLPEVFRCTSKRWSWSRELPTGEPDADGDARTASRRAVAGRLRTGGSRRCVDRRRRRSGGVRVRGDAAVGRAAVTTAPDGTRWAGLSAVRVADGQRRRGHARALCSALLAWAGEQRAATCATSQVLADNAAAITLYESTWASRLQHRARYVDARSL